jgi:hypothetical protein
MHGWGNASSQNTNQTSASGTSTSNKGTTIHSELHIKKGTYIVGIHTALNSGVSPVLRDYLRVFTCATAT